MVGCRKGAGIVIVRFEDGEELVDAFRQLCCDLHICGGVVSAVGAVREAELSVFDPKTKTYSDTVVKENCEIVSLTGFASVMGGQPWPHLHIALGRPDFTVVGGHLKKAYASPTCEMALHTVDRLERKRGKCGLALLDLKPGAEKVSP